MSARALRPQNACVEALKGLRALVGKAKELEGYTDFRRHLAEPGEI